MMLVWFINRVHLVHSVVITEYVQLQGGPLTIIWRVTSKGDPYSLDYGSHMLIVLFYVVDYGSRLGGSLGGRYGGFLS